MTSDKIPVVFFEQYWDDCDYSLLKKNCWIRRRLYPTGNGTFKSKIKFWGVGAMTLEKYENLYAMFPVCKYRTPSGSIYQSCWNISDTTQQHIEISNFATQNSPIWSTEGTKILRKTEEKKTIPCSRLMAYLKIYEKDVFNMLEVPSGCEIQDLPSLPVPNFNLLKKRI
jgi:hypothetical protein